MNPRYATPLSEPISQRQQSRELHRKIFLFACAAVFVCASTVDCIAYNVLKLEHIKLMYTVVSFTGLAAAFVGLCGIFSVRERKTLDPLFYKKVKKELVPQEELERHYRVRLFRYIYVTASGVLYILAANSFVKVLVEIHARYFETR